MKTLTSEIVKNTNRIIAYGCSYTSGAELMDHVYLNMTFDRCNSIKKYFSFNPTTVSKFSKFYNIKEADSLNRQNSWAAHLSKKLNKSFENRAEQGSGLDQVYFKICEDLRNGLINKDDLVIVGLIDIDRVIVFNHVSIRSLLLGWQLRDNNPHDVTLVELLNDDWLFFNYYKTLKLMLLLNDKINIRFQPMTVRQNLEKYDSLTYVRDYANEVWEELQPLILSKTDVLELKEGQQLCGFRHHPVESHIDLADRIYSKLTGT
jgi:hypothetical protein